jgi:hypothetical protein
MRTREKRINHKKTQKGTKRDEKDESTNDGGIIEAWKDSERSLETDSEEKS